jgi:protein-S-isoprenylcysteine O-methyltransferase Ste14
MPRVPLREEFQRQGDWLFRRRSALPFLGLPLLALAFREFSFPWGDPALQRVWEIACLSLSLGGLAIRVRTTGCTARRTSGRNTGKGQVADSLNTGGMYSVVRHPLYLGNFVMCLGPILFFRLWWAALLFVPAFWMYYERIMFAEEEFLREKFGDAYRAWADATPALWPDPQRWKDPELPFSWRTAGKRETQTFLLLIMAFFGLDLAGTALVRGTFALDPFWTALLAAAFAAWIAVRILRKTTGFFRVER